MVNVQKKRGENSSFFIKHIFPDSNKNDWLDNLQRVHKSPERDGSRITATSKVELNLGYCSIPRSASVLIVEKLKSFDLQNVNIQNVTPEAAVQRCSVKGVFLEISQN